MGVFQSAGAWGLSMENLELNLSQFQFQLSNFHAHICVTLSELLLLRWHDNSTYITELLWGLTMYMKRFQYLPHEEHSKRFTIITISSQQPCGKWGQQINGIPELQVMATWPCNYSAPVTCDVLRGKAKDPWHAQSHPSTHTRIPSSHPLPFWWRMESELDQLLFFF